MWRHYHTGTKALIFVIDSQDRDRIHEARLELHRILAARELADAILLVFANKQDLAHSMSTEEVRERLQLDKFPHRLWTVRASCATSGEGLVEGLNWLAENIRHPPKTINSNGGGGVANGSGNGSGSLGSPISGNRATSPLPPLSPSPVGLAAVGSPVFSAAPPPTDGDDQAEEGGEASNGGRFSPLGGRGSPQRGDADEEE